MDSDTVRQIVTSISHPQIVVLDAEHQVALLPPDFRAEDISKYLPPAARIQQRVTLLTPEDLAAYIVAYGAATSGNSVAVFANEPEAKYEAVLDYHLESGERGHGDHVASYACPLSLQWKAWLGQNAKPMKQEHFARFIEDNRPDIHSPPAAEMLQIALQLQVHKSAKFNSDLRLDNGQRQLGYVEEVRGSTKTGNLEIPEQFQLLLPVFVDGTPEPMDARLRYRMNEGELTIWYDLVRPEDVLGDAVKVVTGKIREAIKEKTPSAKVLIGRRG